MKNVNMNPDARLSFLERFAYGIGDYAGNLVYSAISAFLLVYYLFMGGMAVATVGFVLSGLTTSYSLICLSSIIKGIGFGCGGATMFGCLQDAITYGEWYNGYGTAGMGNAASSFCMKVGSGVGTAALGWILAAGGFDAQLKVQSASALSSISIAFAWVPVITSVICVICMAFFNVDKYYAKVVEDLSQGKHRGE